MGAVYNANEVTDKKDCNKVSKSYPTQINSNYYSPFLSDENDYKTVVMSNCFNSGTQRTISTSELSLDSLIETNVSPNIQRTAIKLPNRAKSRKQKVQGSNLRNSPHADTMFNTSHIKIAMDMAISDDGATGHFLIPGT